MPIWVISAAKGIFMHLATKYAAELLFDFTLTTLEKAAAKTETKFDNELVTKVANERDIILAIIKQS